MKNPSKIWLAISALMFSLFGCAAGGIPEGAAHLSASECRDLTARRNNAPITPQRNQSELAALEKAGYDPFLSFDPNYPADLQAARVRLINGIE